MGIYKRELVYISTCTHTHPHVHTHTHIHMCTQAKRSQNSFLEKGQRSRGWKEKSISEFGFLLIFFFFQNRSGTDTWLLGRDTCVILTKSCSGERKQQMKGGLHTKDSQACSLDVCQCWYLLEARVHFLLPIRNHNHLIFLMSLKSSKYVLFIIIWRKKRVETSMSHIR